MERPLSIAIETSCRRGQVCLGAGQRALETVIFQADQRHAVQLIARMEELLGRYGRRPADLEEIYVSIGPGGFTGLRVGLTVARTLGQAVSTARCVAVPTIQAVAQNAAGLGFQHLGAVMDAKEGTVYLGLFARRDGQIVAVDQPRLVSATSVAKETPKPILLIGEALGCFRPEGEGISIGDEALWLPTAEGVWRVGRWMAGAGEFTPFSRLLPLYLRKPEAVRQWEKRARTAK